MNSEPRSPLLDLQSAIADTVALGRDVRKRVANLVDGAARGSRGAAHGLRDVATAVARGAADGARRATRSSDRGVLRDVVDGLGDGIARTALAAKLAVDEAGGRGRKFARQDLDRLTDDLAGAANSVRAAFADAFTAARETVAGEAEDLRRHVALAAAMFAPTVQSTLDTIRRDPSGFAADAARAGAEAARQGAGALFEAIAGFMDRAAQRLRNSEPGGGSNQ